MLLEESKVLSEDIVIKISIRILFWIEKKKNSWEFMIQ